MPLEEDKTGAAAQIEAADLNLIDEKLADVHKDDAELWGELDAADKPATSANAADFADEQADVAAAPAGEAVQAAEPDIWASAPPELKQAYDALAADKAKLEQSHRSDSGRIAAYQRRYEELAKAAQPRQRATVAPTRALEPLMTDYPEIAGPLKEALGSIEVRLDEQNQIEESRRKAAETELGNLVDTETLRLEQEHPDWLETLKDNGPAFAAWVEDQPRRIREAAYRNSNAIVDASEATEVVSMFKAHIGMTPAAVPAPRPHITPHPPLNDRRERQLAATASPQRTGGRPTVSGIPEDGDPQQIWDAFDAQERARA